MEESQHIKTIYTIVAVLVIVGIGYFIFTKNWTTLPTQTPTSSKSDETPINVVVKNAPIVNGALSTPLEFPQEIPFEKAGIIESAITEFPDQGTKQFTLSYNSTKTMAAKYAEYKNYMQKMGYVITEGDKNSAIRTIYGVKEEANMSVVVNNANGKTLVQLTYLLK